MCTAIWGRAHHGHLANNYNVLISRVRRSLATAGLDPHSLERRPGSTRLRLGQVELR